MIDKSNKKFWDKFAKLYAPFMKKDKGVYDKVCEYIRPHLNKDMETVVLMTREQTEVLNYECFMRQRFCNSESWTSTGNDSEEILATTLDHELIAKFAKEFMELYNGIYF